MQSIRAYRPSAGVLMVLFIHAATVGLILWGASTPQLDRVWTLEHELKAGIRAELTEQDRATFRTAFSGYPGLAEKLVDGEPIALLSAHRDGWSSEGAAVVGRLPGPERTVTVQVESMDQELPVEVVFDGEGWRQRLEFETNGALAATLPNITSAEVVQVTARGGRERDAKVAFRLSYGESR